MNFWIVPLVGLFCLWPPVSGGVALLLGIAIALTAGNPHEATTKKLTPQLLSFSVIGLGAGMNLLVVAQVGLHGIGSTILSISMAFLVGTFLGRLFKINRNASLLITVGTAICGGSAIAAVAPILRAKDSEISISLGIVFLLNACALFIFPWLGHHLALSEDQFGLWSALAIHDTSSVVGANMQYGPHALQVGTTVKLARALWIVPVAFLMGLWMQRQTESTNISEGRSPAKKPWFILGFLIMAALVTWIPALQPAGHGVETIAKRFLVVTLFLIGTHLNATTLKAVGPKPFAQGFALWVIMASGTLFALLNQWI